MLTYTCAVILLCLMFLSLYRYLSEDVIRLHHRVALKKATKEAAEGKSRRPSYLHVYSGAKPLVDGGSKNPLLSGSGSTLVGDEEAGRPSISMQNVGRQTEQGSSVSDPAIEGSSSSYVAMTD